MRCLLFFLTQNIKQHTSQLGFTLMELLTVISLMAIIATMAITSYDGTQEQGRYDVTKFEMNQIRKALIQFRQDSGSNDFPMQGVYDCVDIDDITKINPAIDAQLPTEAGTTDADKIAWCQHPANFWMLFENPLATDWNIDTKRGWNGPYLQRKDGYLTLDSNTTNIADIATPVWAIADPYVENQQSTGVQWSVNTDSEILNKAALPYLFLVDLSNDYQPRIVSASDDGEFGNHNNAPADDKCATATANTVDQVLCLLN
jgi:prepilin-type N-terminal cleavage/methylation domain-containing protein